MVKFIGPLELSAKPAINPAKDFDILEYLTISYFQEWLWRITTLPRTTTSGNFSSFKDCYIFRTYYSKLAKDAAFAVANLLFLGEMRSFYIFLEMSRKKTDAN